MKHGDQTRIARAAGMQPSTICDYLKRRTTPSAKAAAKLEASSGIHRLHWLYPDQYDQFGHPLPTPAQPQDGAA